MINTKELLKQIENLGKSIKEVALELDIKENTLLNWLTGKTSLTLTKAEKLQSVLKIDDSEFEFYFFRG